MTALEVVGATLRVGAAFAALGLLIAVASRWPETAAAALAVYAVVALACAVSVPIVAGVIALRDRSGR